MQSIGKFSLGLSILCNIAHVIDTKTNNFLLKTTIGFFKNYIFNIKYTSSNIHLPL